MAANEFQFQTPLDANTVSTDIAKNSKIIEEGPSVCPLCRSVVRKYYINFHETIFMCSNYTCEYPFGEKFSVYSSDDEGSYSGNFDLTNMPRKRYTRSNRSTRSGGISSRGTSTLGTNSNLSASEWAEMSRATSQSYDSDDNSSLNSSKFSRKTSPRLIEKRAKKQQEEQIIKQNVEKIKECNKALFETQEEFSTIRNEKWIRNLSTMQSSSGMRLVKENELHKLKSSEDICHGELKIDIESKTDAMSSIVIEIGNMSPIPNKKFKES